MSDKEKFRKKEREQLELNLEQFQIKLDELKKEEIEIRKKEQEKKKQERKKLSLLVRCYYWCWPNKNDL